MFVRVLMLAATAALAGCYADARTAPPAQPRVVQVADAQPAGEAQLRLSGTVRAGTETPLGFRVSGQVVRRLVQAGERVHAGQVLMELDGADLARQRRASEARVASARAQAQATEREQRRQEDLVRRQLVSVQMYDQAVTAARAAAEALTAAQAELDLAQSAVSYSTLRASADGVVVETHAEPGQVVSAGQQLVLLAEDGPREAEVYIPEQAGATLARRGTASGPGLGQGVPLRLREQAGAADARTRTWRARYTLELPPGQDAPGLGTTVTVVLDRPGDTAGLLRVPVAAVVERGAGAFVWQVRDGAVQAVPVQLHRMDADSAYVTGALTAQAPVVAAGAHLLNDGERVRTRTL